MAHFREGVSAGPWESLKKRTSRVVHEKFAVPNVSRQHGVRRMAGLLSDRERRDARLRRAGGGFSRLAASGRIDQPRDNK